MSDESPEREASAKLAQYLAVAAQVAEAAVRMRQAQVDRSREATAQNAAAVRAEQRAQHTAARTVYARGADREWVQSASLDDLARTWGAAAGWADADPMAGVVAARVEQRFGDIAPQAMAHYDQLREQGAGRLDAMQDTVERIAVEVRSQRRVFVADAGPTTSTATPTDAQTDAQTDAASDARAAQSHADAAAGRAHGDAATVDDLRTAHVDEHEAGVAAAGDDRADEATWQRRADLGWRSVDDGAVHPADVAGASAAHTGTFRVTPARSSQPGRGIGRGGRTPATTRTARTPVPARSR